MAGGSHCAGGSAGGQQPGRLAGQKPGGAMAWQAGKWRPGCSTGWRPSGPMGQKHSRPAKWRPGCSAGQRPSGPAGQRPGWPVPCPGRPVGWRLGGSAWQRTCGPADGGGVGVATHLLSQCVVAWRSLPQARGSGFPTFSSPLCFISAKCVFCISARSLIHGAHAV
jgi:hypothetical protein